MARFKEGDVVTFKTQWPWAQRDVRIVRLYEGTSQIQQIIIAREMMRGQKA